VKSLISPADEAPFVSDHTGYGPGGESFEHDDTGSINNYSGCEDDMVNAQIEHEGWQEGYDY
jgi:hypothetical protein